ncbi:sister chromatid cohesion protein 1 [Teratosphaeriaceae sp. CCFEE 6253]|nr:sister chromatid cohesion protein 1 [Teratosphaeriaceae sp. CCFEE 6253]
MALQDHLAATNDDYVRGILAFVGEACEPSPSSREELQQRREDLFLRRGQLYRVASYLAGRLESMEEMAGHAALSQIVQTTFVANHQQLGGLMHGVLEEAIHRQPESFQEPLSMMLLFQSDKPSQLEPSIWHSATQRSPETPPRELAMDAAKTPAGAPRKASPSRARPYSEPRAAIQRSDSLVDDTCRAKSPTKISIHAPRRSAPVIQQDAKTEFLHHELKSWREDHASIARPSSSLPKNKTLLNILQRQRECHFVDDAMPDGRMQDWAPELREIFSFNAILEAAKLNGKSRSSCWTSEVAEQARAQ